MPDYEDVHWQTDYLKCNRQKLDDKLAQLVGREFAGQVCTLAQQPGPLHVCLSRAYHDFNTSLVIAKFLSLAWQNWPSIGTEELVDLLCPLMRWDYGMEPLAYGLEELEASNSTVAVELTRIEPTRLPLTVQCVWLVGLLGLSYLPGTRDRDLDDLLSPTGAQKETTSACQSLTSVAAERFEELWVSLIDTAFDPQEVLSDKLWQNALVMAERHKWLENGQPEVLQRLLAHVRDGGGWPLPGAENDHVILCAKQHRCEGFWMDYPSMQVAKPFALRLEFLSNALEILNIGNAFDTCMRLGGQIGNTLNSEEVKLLGWASNANIRVVVARGTDDRILGRRTIALSLENEPGVVQCPTYPKGYADMQSAIDRFVQDFASCADLNLLTHGTVRETCAPFYDEFGQPD